jgi:hypothetical protein
MPFKFLRDRRVLLVRNAKSADRRSSGKFITVYPRDEAELEALLHELGTDLADAPGPDILSDLRWTQGPVHVRYGAFVERHCLDATGDRVPALEDADGTLVPDVRGTTFTIPPWVTLPAVLEPARAARAAISVGGLPYRIDSALHFSNGGGVYRGVDRGTGDDVVLKEARPHAGLSRDGDDAVARLHHERATLEHLAGLDCVPVVRDVLTAGSHHFLVLDHVPGAPLNKMVVDRYPLVSVDADEDAAATYTAWALDVADHVRRAVDAVHSRGVVMGDLHPGNILVADDGSVVLVDWEVAGPVDDEDRPHLGVPGFVAPPGVTGIDADRYARALVELFVFLPLTRVVVLDPGKLEQVVRVIADHFPVPRSYLEGAVATISAAAPTDQYAPEIEPTPSGWQRARDAMAGAINASATQERDDRLFPGDPLQFERGGGVNLAYGAAGVLYALDAVGAGVADEHVDWLERHATAALPTMPLGFYDGLFGVAHVLDRLGRAATAERLVETGLERLAGREHEHGLDLHSGLSGIALGLEAAGHHDRAAELAHHAADRLDSERRIGLFHGSSGPALLFIRRYERTGDDSWLDLAADALHRDLAGCVTARDGSLHVDEGWRTLPYLARGSVGIGVVIDEYLRHRPDEAMLAAQPGLRLAASSPFYVLPGVFEGRAGIILTLRGDPLATDHIPRLAWHAVAYEGGLAFPGRGLLRLSMDLATGTAGVLLAVGAALGEGNAGLPLVG